MLDRYVRMRFSDASWVLKPELKDYLLGRHLDNESNPGLSSCR